MSQILALTVKDLRLLLRDKAGFFFVLFFPLLYGTFFGFIMSGFGGGGGDGGGGSMPIRVVDEDGTEASAKFIARLTDADELRVTVQEREAAADDVRTGRAVAFVLVPEGFGEAGDTPFWGDPQRLVVGVDPARKAEAGMLQGILMQYAFEGLQDMMTNPAMMQQTARDAMASLQDDSDMSPATRLALSALFSSMDTLFENVAAVDAVDDASGDGDGASDAMQGWEPVSIEIADVTRRAETEDDGGPRSAFEISFPQATVWGVMGCAAAFGISLVVERVRGTLVRLRTAPISLTTILAGKAGACFVAVLSVATLMFTVAALPPFRVRPDLASLALLVVAVLSVAVCFVGLMMLLAVTGKTEASAGGIGWACLLVMAMLGGGMVPLMVMPAWMQTVGNVSPVKWAILALEGALWRDFTLLEMLRVCGILIGIGVASFVVGTMVFRRTAGD